MSILNKITLVIKAIVSLPYNALKVKSNHSAILINEKKIELLEKENKERFKTELSNLISNFEKKIDLQFLQFEALLSIYNSLPNLKFLPVTRGWAGSPDFLLKIVELTLKEKPRFVLEAGSGASTIVIGLALQLNKLGKSISLDHELHYTESTTKSLHLNEISSTSIVKHCQICDYNYFNETWKWYTTKNLNLTEKIDMLIIDGPPRSTQFLARYPAIPLLHEHFADRILIILDDSNRNDEIITIERWISFLEFNKFDVLLTEFKNFEKGLVVLDVYRKKNGG